MEKNKRKIRRLVFQIVILVLFYAFCRLLFIVFNKSAFEISTFSAIVRIFAGGIRFDLSAIFIINSVFIFFSLLPVPFISGQRFQKFLHLLFLVSNSFFLLLNLVDIAYFPFIQKRMQLDAFLFLNGKKGNEFFTLLPGLLLQYWHLCIGYGLMVWLLYKAYRQTLVQGQIFRASFKIYLSASVVFLAGIALSVIAIRGGLQLKPLSIIDASEMGEARNIPAIINTPFSLVKTINNKGLPYVEYFTAVQMQDLNKGIHLPSPNKAFRRQNVVIIIVESLSKKYISFFHGKGNTPFLDSLFSQSLVFSNGFANARESVQGIPAIISSIPSWQDEPFIFSSYAANRITSIPNLLKKQGYTSSFFHGGTNGTMGFNSYCNLAGFDHYFGRTEYNNEKDFDGDWGIWDEPFLQFMAGQLSQMEQPFFSTVFTLNTHHPFTIPDKYRQTLSQSGHPMLSCIRYADKALSGFFETARKMPWFNNTIFVITADHTAPAIDNGNTTLLDDYRIPIAFYQPGSALRGINESIVSQIDILPSVMHLLQYPYPYFAFGNNVFGNSGGNFSIDYNGSLYQYIDSSYCYQFNGQNSVGLYNWRQDSLLSKNLHQLNPQPEEQNLEMQLKKRIQLFNLSLINNQMQAATSQ